MTAALTGKTVVGVQTLLEAWFIELEPTDTVQMFIDKIKEVSGIQEPKPYQGKVFMYKQLDAKLSDLSIDFSDWVHLAILK